MKKELSIILGLASAALSAQNVVFSQDFNTGADLTGWQVMDRDRDGTGWNLFQGSDSFTALAGWDGDAGRMAGSYSYELFLGKQGPLDADDVLVSAPIQLPAANSCTLTFKIGTTYAGMDDMTYQLFVLEDGQDWYPTLQPLEERQFVGLGTAQVATADLAAFKGKKIRIYWRHYKSFGQFFLFVDDVKIVENASLAVQDSTKETGLSVYPNPVSDILYFKGFQRVSGYKVFNASGQLVQQGGASTQVEVKSLLAGVYFLVVEDEGGRHSFKFIKK